MERPPRLPLLARRPQQPALRVAKVTFHRIIGPCQRWDIIAMKQARPLALADLVHVTTEVVQQWRSIALMHHRIALPTQVTRDVLSTEGGGVRWA